MSNSIYNAPSMEAAVTLRPSSGPRLRENLKLTVGHRQSARAGATTGEGPTNVEIARSGLANERKSAGAEPNNDAGATAFSTLIEEISLPIEQSHGENVLVAQGQPFPALWASAEVTLLRETSGGPDDQGPVASKCGGLIQDGRSELPDQEQTAAVRTASGRTASARQLTTACLESLQAYDLDAVQSLSARTASMSTNSSLDSTAPIAGRSPFAAGEYNFQTLRHEADFSGGAAVTSIETHFRPGVSLAAVFGRVSIKLNEAGAGEPGPVQKSGSGNGHDADTSAEGRGRENTRFELRAGGVGIRARPGGERRQNLVDNDLPDGIRSQNNSETRRSGSAIVMTGPSNGFDPVPSSAGPVSPSQQVGTGIAQALGDLGLGARTDYVSIFTDRAEMRGPIARTLELSLDPAELGHVQIRMNLTGTGLRLEIEAARQETAQLLSDEHAGLDRSLRDAGLDLASMSIFVTLRDAGTQPALATSGPPEGAAARAGDAAQDVSTSLGSQAQDQRKPPQNSPRITSTDAGRNVKVEGPVQSSRSGGKELYI